MTSYSRPLKAATVLRYHAEKWTVDDYYSEKKKVQGYWFGELAEHFGLKGAIQDEDFRRIMTGRRPDAAYDAYQLAKNWERTKDGYILRDTEGKVAIAVTPAHHNGWQHSLDPGRRFKSLEYAQESARNALLGKAINYRDRAKERRAWDIVMRPGKTVSIAAIVGGDQRIINLHRSANRAALERIQQLIQARGGPDNMGITTGKFLVARFEHYASRPEETEELTGEKVLRPTPLLHTHNVMANMTITADGQLRSIDSTEMFDFQRVGKMVYQTVMAHGLRNLGYDVEYGLNGSPEIQGFTREYLDSESLRRDAIVRELKERGVSSPAAAEIAAHHGRNNKLDLSDEDMRTIFRENAALYGNQADHIVTEAKERAPHVRIEPVISAAEAVTLAKESLAYNYAVFEHWDLIHKAMEYGQGYVLPDAVEAEVKRRTQTADEHALGVNRELMLAMHERTGKPGIRYTTDIQYGYESRACQLMNEGRNQVAPLTADFSVARADELFRQLVPGGKLNADQQNAIEVTITSPDRVTAIQGGAGTGKTAVLQVIRQYAEEAGFRTLGVSSTHRGVEELQSAGISSVTLESFLQSKPDASDSRPLYLISDETSLAATRQCVQALDGIATQNQSRTLLVGDIGQHESIEAARVFDLLQQAGMRTALIRKNVRQIPVELKQAVEQCYVGRHVEALDLLAKHGRVQEISEDAPRLKAVIDPYLRSPANSVIINPDNQGRKELNALVRIEQKAQGVIGKDGITTQVLVPRQDLTSTDLKLAFKFDTGDIVQFRQGSKEANIKRGSHWIVASRDARRNLVTVYKPKPDGTDETRVFNPKLLRRFDVYRREQREFCVGDKLLFKRKDKTRRIVNGTVAHVEAIDGRTVTAKLAKQDRVVSWNAPADGFSELPHIEYGHATTSYSIQGATTRNTYVHLDSSNKTAKLLIGKALFYVAISRPKHELKVFTDSTTKVRGLLERSREKGMALSPEERSQYRPEVRHHQELALA
jgi:conjugative relaxase-like TrwC/TraI family protein